jgi:dsDNA-specific endonuclease/ATPase MutS2
LEAKKNFTLDIINQEVNEIKKVIHRMDCREGNHGKAISNNCGSIGNIDFAESDDSYGRKLQACAPSWSSQGIITFAANCSC